MMEVEPRDADLTLLKQNDIMNCFIKRQSCVYYINRKRVNKRCHYVEKVFL